MIEQVAVLNANTISIKLIFLLMMVVEKHN